jgi:putative flavoprotein involved in K+ transport
LIFRADFVIFNPEDSSTNHVSLFLSRSKMTETIETVIVGGGQAGLSLSYFLTQAGREHIVLEMAAQAGEAWRNHRWDSFCLVTPNRAFRLPGAEYRGPEPEGFMPRRDIVQSFERYIDRYHLPVRYQTEMLSVEADSEPNSYLVKTSGAGRIQARNVVVATGLFQQAKIPAFASEIAADIRQMGSDEYRNPDQLPPGAVMVVGAGQSGCQIAEELNQSGRKVFLCASGAPRIPRRYRGQDIFDWLIQIGFIDRTPEMLPSPRARFGANPQVTGKNGGHNLNLHQFYRDGIVLLGHLLGVEERKLCFAADLHECLAKTDQIEKDILKRIDEVITNKGIDAPEEAIVPLADGFTAPEWTSLDPVKEGIRTMIWAGGYRFDYSMVRLAVTDAYGFPVTQRGATPYRGLYFLGMPFLYKMKSGLLIGVGEDAEYLAESLAKSKTR